MPSASKGASAGARSLLRSLGCIPVWIMRAVVQGAAPRPPLPTTLFLDALLLGLHLWAVAPIRREMGEEFPSRQHWTGLLWTGVVLAAVFLIRDLWFFANQISL
jgi:hypothetical protein